MGTINEATGSEGEQTNDDHINPKSVVSPMTGETVDDQSRNTTAHKPNNIERHSPRIEKAFTNGKVAIEETDIDALQVLQHTGTPEVAKSVVDSNTPSSQPKASEPTNDDVAIQNDEENPQVEDSDVTLPDSGESVQKESVDVTPVKRTLENGISVLGNYESATAHHNRAFTTDDEDNQPINV